MRPLPLKTGHRLGSQPNLRPTLAPIRSVDCAPQTMLRPMSCRHLLDAGQPVAKRVSSFLLQSSGFVYSCWSWLACSPSCLQQTQVMVLRARQFVFL